VTGCVFSKACNFLITVGTDCDGKMLACQFVILFSILNISPETGGFIVKPPNPLGNVVVVK